MKVYRYLSQPELDAILSNDTSSIGKDYERNDDYKRMPDNLDTRRGACWYQNRASRVGINRLMLKR